MIRLVCSFPLFMFAAGACMAAPGVALPPAPARPEPASTPAPASPWSHLVRALSWPRAPGAPSRASSVQALTRALTRAGADRVDLLRFWAFDPWSDREVPLVNLVGWVHPGGSRVFILATHFDTPPVAHADPDPARRRERVPGANDGTSGVAVLLAAMPELAARLPADVTLAVVLFDGEELGTPEGGGYLAGSRDLAQRLRDGKLPDLARAEGAIVLDMVGDRDLTILRDPASARAAPWLQDLVWTHAARLGARAFVDRPGPAVGDDHLPLIAAGVPAILLIDRDYERWHTTADDLAGVGRDSLATVTRVVVAATLAWATAVPARAAAHPCAALDPAPSEAQPMARRQVAISGICR